MDNKKKLYAENLIDYILESLNNLGVYPTDPQIENNVGKNYYRQYLYINIKFNTQCFGEPLKDSDGDILTRFINETISEFIKSTTKNMLPKGVLEYRLFTAYAYPYKGQFPADSFTDADYIAFAIYLKPIKG